MTTMKKLMTLILGNTIASLGIAMTVNSGFGCFAITAANISFSNMFGISIGLAGMITETIMLLLATYKGEGIGVTAICNAVYGSLTVDLFMRLVPKHPIMILGLLILPIGWSLMGKAGLGDTGSNILMNAIMKSSGKSMGLIRGIEECVCVLIGFIGARQYVTIFTIILSLFFGYLMNLIYKLINYDPISIKHKFIIGGK